MTYLHGSIRSMLFFFFFFGVPFFSPLFVWHRVVSQTRTSTVEPDIPGIILWYDALYTLHVFIHAECCCRCCHTTAVVAAAAAVRHRVPDDKIVADSLNLIASSVFLPSFSNPIYF